MHTGQIFYNSIDAGINKLAILLQFLLSSELLLQVHVEPFVWKLSFLQSKEKVERGIIS